MFLQFTLVSTLIFLTTDCYSSYSEYTFSNEDTNESMFSLTVVSFLPKNHLKLI